MKKSRVSSEDLKVIVADPVLASLYGEPVV